MKATLLNDEGGLRTFAVVLETGDEAMASLTNFAAEHKLRATQFTAIGAFSRVVVAFFDWTTKRYHNIPIDEQVEVLSLVGDITLEKGKPKVHAHVVVGKADGTAHGGHLVEGHVRPTLEIVLDELPRHLQRRYDSASGLNLIDPSAGALGRLGCLGCLSPWVTALARAPFTTQATYGHPGNSGLGPLRTLSDKTSQLSCPPC